MIEYRERPVPVEVVKWRTAPVDARLLVDCPPVSLSEVGTNGELLDAAIEANKRLAQCDADKEELRGLLNGEQ